MLPKKIMILDTETVNIEKCFVYDIGFIIAELNEEGFYLPIEKTQFIIEQVYDNRELFTTAYYNKKREKYTSLMKGKRAKKIKLGYATQSIINTLKKHQIEYIFAYNSNFDKKVFEFNSDYYKIKNPFDKKEFVDILGIANNFIHLTQAFCVYAMDYNFVNESGFLQTNAEVTFGFLKDNPKFIEEHTSLQDCEIELEILNECIKNGYQELGQYKQQFIKSNMEQILRIITSKKTYEFRYTKKRNTKKGIVLE
jgi:hypothetical protein